jgi:hypothetical protein
MLHLRQNRRWVLSSDASDPYLLPLRQAIISIIAWVCCFACHMTHGYNGRLETKAMVKWWDWSLRWYFRKLNMAIGSLHLCRHWFLRGNLFRHGIDSSHDSIPPVWAHVLDESLFHLLKLRFMSNGRLYSTLGSYMVPTWFLTPMAASIIGPQDCPLYILLPNDKTERHTNIWNLSLYYNKV